MVSLAGLGTGATVNVVINGVDNFSGTLNRASGKLGAFGKIAGGVFKTVAIGAGVAGAALIGIGTSAIKSAVDLEETRSKFATIFKDVSDQSEKVAKDLQKNFGLSGQAAKKLLSNTGDLLSGFGFMGKEALDMSESVNKLAVDLASFSNATGGAEAVSNALTKALLGERESLKTYGIAILDADVKTRLAEKGLDKLTGTALRQAKAQATLELAMEQSKNAIGDFGRTQDSAANRMRIMQARVEDLKDEIGTALLPTFTNLLTILSEKVIPAFEPLLPIITNLLNMGLNKLNDAIVFFGAWWNSNGSMITEIAKNLFQNTLAIGTEIAIRLFDLFKNNEDTIKSVMVTTGEIGTTVVEIFKQVFGAAVNIFDWLNSVGFFDFLIAGFDLVASVILRVVDLIKDLFGWIGKVAKTFAESGIGQFITKGVKAGFEIATDVTKKVSQDIRPDTADDFISRPGQPIQRFSPHDTIMGVKHTDKQKGGNGIVVNIDTVSGADPDMIAVALQRRLKMLITSQ